MSDLHLFRWDLDKTYLRTEFETLRGMLRAARESAEDKTAYPGAKALLVAVSKQIDHRLGIVSGSPNFMRTVLSKKLQLDGVQVDQMVLKPQLRSLRKLRFRAMRDQVGYKLPALLQGRIALGPDLPETLVGDDVEMDAFVYSLYADALAGRVDEDELRRVLTKARLYPDVIDQALELLAGMQHGDYVQRILVHLDKRTAPGHFQIFGKKVVPFHNYLQAAAVLYADGRIQLSAAVDVARALVALHGYDFGALAGSIQDIVRRNALELETARELVAELDKDPILARGEFEKRLSKGLPGDFCPPTLPELATVSYAELYDIEQKRRYERKKLQRRRSPRRR